MREKELRLALVCYGGVSLAVYMHGIVKELWKLLRASRAFHADPKLRDGLSGSELIWFELFEALAPHVSLRVMVDIVAGASAGGINGIQLAHAIAGGHDMEPLRDMWLKHADVDMLIDNDQRRSSIFIRMLARPLVWFMRRPKSGADLDDVAADPAAAEVTAKLRRFVRARWFEPPFSGPGFTRLLHNSLGEMEQGRPGGALLPPEQPLDLFVTVTDFHGTPERLPLHSPAEIVETEHRLVIGFRDEGGAMRRLAHRAELAFAARATASFPGAFPPFQPRELDTVLTEDHADWPDRDAFLARILPRHAAAGLDPSVATLIDGSVLNNRPFGPAIDALGRRPAHREVDRRFVYIDPKPGGHLVGVWTKPGEGRPGFFRTILRALSDIPREQPIRDSVEALNALSARVRRLRHIVEAMRPPVDAAIERALGRTLRFFSITPARLTDWRSKVQTAAATEAGFAYPAYAHLKLSQVVEQVGGMLGGTPGTRGNLWRWVAETGTDRTTAGDAKSAYVIFLKRFDLQYRVRRLRFLIRRTSELISDADGPERAALERAKTGLYRALAPYLDRRAVARVDPAGETVTATLLDRLEGALGLTVLDAATDAGLQELLNDPELSKAARRALVLAYLGFPFFDIATLPLLQGDGVDEFDEIKVDRISPDDCTAFGAGMLKGLRFNAFGAFFSRAWRENDYLLGRLHAAERLIEIVTGAMPTAAALPPGAVTRLRRSAFRAILEEERPHLQLIPDLFARLEAELGTT